MYKKSILSLLAIMVVMLSSVCFFSCSKDNDGDNEQSLIVGTWRHEDTYGYDILTFNSNGTGTWSNYYYEGKKELLDEIEPFDYTFNENSMTLKMLFGDEVETWKVESLTKDRAIFDGDVYIRM